MKPSAAPTGSSSRFGGERRSPLWPSNSPATAQAGGDLGWVLPGSLDPAIDAAIEKLPLRQASDPIRTPSGFHVLYVIDRRPFASARPDDVRLNLVQMTLALPVNASPEETNRATTDAQKAMTAVRQCNDLHAQSRQLKGATAGDLTGVRVGDLAANRQMYEEIPRLAVGGTAGPFRVAEGLQVVALCSKEGASGLPTRDVISQQILLQKLEAAGRRYMREAPRSDHRNQAMTAPLPLAVTMGEPAGIGANSARRG
jgi:peptidyl-prolyl cis-trans isomerase SurA